MKELFQKIFKKMRDELFTIPNMLSILRLLLIPVIVYLYCFKHDVLWTCIMVVLSSLTDIVDGFIARTFNMITDFGKFLDPLAAKATQIVVMACLVTEFWVMLIPCIILFVKEIVSLVMRVIIYKNTEVVDGARWHGKLATCTVIAMIGIHLIWHDQLIANPIVSYCVVGICTFFVILSTVLYMVYNVKMLTKHGKQEV